MNGLRRLTLIYHFISLIQLRAAAAAAAAPRSAAISPLHPPTTAVRVLHLCLRYASVRVHVCMCVCVCTCMCACAPLLAFTPDQLFRWQKRREKRYGYGTRRTRMRTFDEKMLQPSCCIRLPGY